MKSQKISSNIRITSCFICPSSAGCKAECFSSYLQTWVWIGAIVVGVSKAGLGYFGYNEKMGTCFIISYCFINYVYVCGVITGTLYLPAAIITSVAYTKIILKLREVRRNLEKHDFNRQISKTSMRLTSDSTSLDLDSYEQSLTHHEQKGMLVRYSFGSYTIFVNVEAIPKYHR